MIDHVYIKSKEIQDWDAQWMELGSEMIEHLFFLM